jgi:beta-galactosidase/beta-glucuronidase
MRLGNYPTSDVVYELCDELGLIVWGQLRWCRDGDWSEIYMLDLAAWHLRVQEVQPRHARPARRKPRRARSRLAAFMVCFATEG